MTRAVAIVNPRSGGGRTGRAWPDIERRLTDAIGAVEARFTDRAAPGAMPATNLARRALGDGAGLVIAVGGDGTINETVNGFFEGGKAVNPDAELAILSTGTGGDFRRTFGLPADLEACIARLAEGAVRRIDLGRLHFVADDGREASRYFNNIASFGMSGRVDRAVNQARVPKLLGGSFTFFWCSLTTALTYRAPAVRIRADTGFDRVVSLGTAAVANGRFFGGGMMIAPAAEPDDGLFDLVILPYTGFFDLLASSRAVYKGSHVEDDRVTVLRAARVEAEPADAGAEVLLDIDGEAPGRLPARFEIVPGALNLRA